MNKFVAEYGKFIVAIVGSAFLFIMFAGMIQGYKEYSVKFIQAITGVNDASYIETNSGGGAST